MSYIGKANVYIIFKSQRGLPVNVPLYIMLNNSWDVQLFIHNEEEEFWLMWSEFPYEIISKRLEFESGGNMAVAQISMMEKQTLRINKEHFPCQSYTSEEFITCAKQQLWFMLMPSVNCTVAGYESIVHENVKYCDSLNMAKTALSQIFSSLTDFFSNFSQYKCPLPCLHRSYNFNIKYFHTHSWIGLENYTTEIIEKTGLVSLTYSSLLIEDRVEAYVYDLENFMTSIGGNLGLFLGFSCFSTFVALLEFFFKKFA